MSDSIKGRLLGQCASRRVLHPGPRAVLRMLGRSTVVFWLVVLTVAEVRLRRLHGLAACAAVARWSRRILRAGGVTLRVQGEVLTEPCLRVSNHRSYLDILVVLSAVPSSFLCKREVRGWPLIGLAAERMGAVFVDRRSPESRRATLQDVTALVASGMGLVAFPEGTTRRGPGMGPTYPGLFRAAEAKGFPVLPMVIEYRDVRDAWVDDQTLIGHILFWLSKPRTEVTLRLGEVLNVPSGAAGALQGRAEAWMREALVDLNTAYDSASPWRGDLP